MKLKKLAVLAMACIMAMTAASLTGCSQNQGSTGTDETQNASSEAGDLQSESGNGETTTAEENTKDVYKLMNPEKINNKKVLIFDDVYTTGTTVKSCINEIAKGKPNTIGILTLARD